MDDTFFFDKKSESKSDTRNVIFDHTDQIGGLKYIDTSPLDATKYGRKKPLFLKLCIILLGGGVLILMLLCGQTESVRFSKQTFWRPFF